MKLRTQDSVYGASPRCAAFLAAALLAFAPRPGLAADLGIGPAPADFDFIELRWGPWAEIGGTYGTEDSSYGELGIFVPLTQTPDSLLFTEIRGKYFEDDLLEGNAMLGYRQMTGSGFNFGAWLGLDVLYTDSDNTFGQVSGGLEALSQYFDLRVNGYYPFTDPQTVADGMAEVVLEGSNIFMVGGEEVALYGVDGEIGGRLPLMYNNATLGIYGGGFWFDHDDIDEAVTGGSARVELALNDIVGAGSQLSAQYKYTDDNVRGDRHLIGARLRIPLGAAPRASEVSPQWLRMVDRIERDVDIVVAPSSGEEPVEDALTGVDFEQVAQVTGSEAGADEIGAVVTDPMRLIVATGIFTGTQSLDPDQTLQGGGSTIQVRGLNSGAVTGFTAPGARPEINAGTAEGLELSGGGNVHAAGLDITTTGNGREGVRVSAGGSNVVVEQMNIATVGPGSHGISFFNGHEDVLVTHNSITTEGSGAVGIRFDENNNDVWVTGNTVTTEGSDADGIQFSDENSDVWVTGNTVTATGSRADGLLLESGNGLTVSDNRFIGAFGGDVIEIFDSGNTLAGTGNVLDGSFGGSFCNVTGAQTGAIGFSDGTTCP